MWPAPSTICSSAPGMPAAMRSPTPTNLASRAPATRGPAASARPTDPTPAPWTRCRPGAGWPPARRPCCAGGRPARGRAARRTVAGTPTTARTPRRRRARSTPPARRRGGVAPARSVSSSMPGRRTDQHEAFDERRRVEGQPQAHPPAHRVADVRGPPAGGADQRGRARHVRRARPAESPWPGASTATTWWSTASRGSHGRHDRPVWVNPWTRTTRSPSRGDAGGEVRQPARSADGAITWTKTSGSWAPGIENLRSIT